MTYLPSSLINSGYSYVISSDYYQVRTNENCYTQYSNTYCDCLNVYFNNDYLIGGRYTCNVNSNSTGIVDSSHFTDNFYYRLDFDKICVIFMVIVILCYFLAFKPISRLFGRWLKL
jgi:hypothetical protein